MSCLYDLKGKHQVKANSKGPRTKTSCREHLNPFGKSSQARWQCWAGRRQQRGHGLATRRGHHCRTLRFCAPTNCISWGGDGDQREPQPLHKRPPRPPTATGWVAIPKSIWEQVWQALQQQCLSCSETGPPARACHALPPFVMETV